MYTVSCKVKELITFLWSCKFFIRMHLYLTLEKHIPQQNERLIIL